MKRLYRTIITALFILTAAAAGLRAQQLPSDYGTVTLPVLSTSTALSMSVNSVDLQVELTDDSGKTLPSYKPSQVRWRDGAWRDERNNILVQLLFPSKILQIRAEIKAKYRLDYSITYLRASGPATLKITEYLPADRAASFSAKADLPVQPVVFDGSDLTYSSAKPGLTAVQLAVTSQSGRGIARNQGMLKAKTALKYGAPVSTAGTVAASITFICNGGSKIEWADNGKDLRKLAPDLIIKLAQPDCD